MPVPPIPVALAPVAIMLDPFVANADVAPKANAATTANLIVFFILVPCKKVNYQIVSLLALGRL
jgi:hypothetical protein